MTLSQHSVTPSITTPLICQCGRISRSSTSLGWWSGGAWRGALQRGKFDAIHRLVHALTLARGHGLDDGAAPVGGGELHLLQRVGKALRGPGDGRGRVRQVVGGAERAGEVPRAHFVVISRREERRRLTGGRGGARGEAEGVGGAAKCRDGGIGDEKGWRVVVGREMKRRSSVARADSREMCRRARVMAKIPLFCDRALIGHDRDAEKDACTSCITPDLPLMPSPRG